MTSVSLKQRVLAYGYLHEQITVGTTRRTRLTFSTQADTIPCIYTRRHFHRERFGLLHQTLSATIATGIGNRFAKTAAFGAGLLYLEKTLLHPYLPRSATTTTGDGTGARLCAAAITGIAVL